MFSRHAIQHRISGHTHHVLFWSFSSLKCLHLISYFFPISFEILQMIGGFLFIIQLLLKGSSSILGSRFVIIFKDLHNFLYQFRKAYLNRESSFKVCEACLLRVNLDLCAYLVSLFELCWQNINPFRIIQTSSC